MEKKNSLVGFILTFILGVTVAIFIAYMGYVVLTGTNNEETQEMESNDIIAEETEEPILDNDTISEFDLSFLKEETKKENMIYSPLSIKYALKMLEEAAEGESKEQIIGVIGEYSPTQYKSGKNMAIANAFFIRNDFKESVKSSYINTLEEKYNAEVKFDSFSNANTLNNWVNEKTFNIIPTIVSDDDVKELDYALVNALAIDMEWINNFLHGEEALEFRHEKKKGDEWYLYNNIIDDLTEGKFKGKAISGMEIEAMINNYDIITELGEDNIKKTVTDEYTKFVRNESYDKEHAGGDFALSESDDTSDERIKKDLDEFFPEYMADLNDSYHKVGGTTDFSVYVDDDVKVFAKDLKEYDGTTLQYIGIMPIKENIDEFVKKADANQISKYISDLKDTAEYKDFKEGLVTVVRGYIPKFNFEYSLNLMEKLKSQGITDVFDMDKANLKNLTDNSSCISAAIHKANIEFTQDGIKAAAATMIGGYGAGEPFNYMFDVPVEEIDLTFDKPYMFVIRDKDTDEIWFVGNVYEPLDWDKDDTKGF